MKILNHPKKSLSFKAILLASLLVNTYSSNAQLPINGKIHAGFVYPISTNGTHAPLDTNNFSLNILAGVSAAERGLTFAGFSNVVLKDAVGSQFAGFSNHIGGKADGASFAGFANTYGGGKNAAFAGFANLAHGNVKGAQFAGFSNLARNVKGVQFAGFANLARNVNGAQFAGFLNQANQVMGPQFAGFINIANKDISSSQFAGFINKSENVKGTQIAGFINIAKKVSGAQIAGFINIADSSDYPIGFINIVKKGEKSIGISIDETQTTMLSLRSGGKVLYGIIGIGYNLKNEDETYAAELGLGAHFLSSRYFRFNAELSAITLESFRPGEYFKSSFKLMPAIKLFSGLEIFGGPALHYVATNTVEGKTLHTNFLKSWENEYGNGFNGIYIGYQTGLHFIF